MRLNINKMRVNTNKMILNTNKMRLNMNKTEQKYKAAFTLIYILIEYILSVNKIIQKWPHFILKPKFKL